MTQDEIIQGNKLIAEFMGWHDEVIQCFTPPNDRTYFCSPSGEEKIVLSYPIIQDELPYHSSWDWLMPVVEKISTIHYGWDEKDDEYEDCAFPRTFGMRDGKGNYLVRINACQVFESPKFIDAVYAAVLDFISTSNNNQ